LQSDIHISFVSFDRNYLASRSRSGFHKQKVLIFLPGLISDQYQTSSNLTVLLGDSSRIL
jgi:hypothetical protein